MKYKSVLLVVLLNLVVLIALALTLPHLMISPGQPIQAHAEIANDCFACHTPFLGSRPEKCVNCHQVEAIGLRTTKGRPIGEERKSVAFHQQLIEADCVACHSDHNGVMAFRPISRFSHELVAESTRERCQGCHAGPDDRLHRKNEGNCSECHTLAAWKPASFNHDEYFRFDRHHDTECATCHRGEDYSGYTCYGCHEHSRAKIREEHEEEGIRDYENCVECHRSGDEDEAEWRWRNRAGGGYRPWRGDDHWEYEGGYRHHDDD